MKRQKSEVECNRRVSRIQVNLKQFSASTGKSDMNITGVLENFYGYMFKKQEFFPYLLVFILK